MSNVRKTLQMTSLLFGMIVLFCYIGWHLGYTGFIIIGEIDLPWGAMYTLCTILTFINLVIVGSFIMEIYTLKIVLYTIPIVLITNVCDILNIEVVIGTGPITVLCFILLAIILEKKRIKRVILRSLIITVVTVGYQIIAIIFKTGKFTLNYEMPMYTVLMFSIDMIILLLLVWSIGGVKNGAKRLEFLVFPGRIRDDRDRDESSQTNAQSPSNFPVNRFERWIVRSVIGVVQILQWMLILWVCSLDHLFLDALVMTTSFICHGMIITKRKHLRPVILCTLATTIMFYLAARYTVSFGHSQFFPILIGLFLVYTMYRVSYHFEKRDQEKSKKYLEKIADLESQLKAAWDYIDHLS